MLLFNRAHTYHMAEVAKQTAQTTAHAKENQPPNQKKHQQHS